MDGKSKHRGNGYDLGSKAAQYVPFTAFYFAPLFTRTLKPGERELYGFMSYRAWFKRTLVIKASIPWLAKCTGMSTGSVKRHLKRLLELRLIRKHGKGPKWVNLHFVEPLLLAEFSWTERPLKHIEQTTLYRMKEPNFRKGFVEAVIAQADQNGPGKSFKNVALLFQPDQNDPGGGSKRSAWQVFPGTLPDQNDPQIVYLYSLVLDDAQRHAATNTIEGGDDAGASHSTAGKRCPTGQDQSPREKGVHRTESKRPKKSRRTQMTRDEQLAFARAQTEPVP